MPKHQTPEEVQQQERQTIMSELVRLSKLSSDEVKNEQNRRCPFCEQLLTPVKYEYIWQMHPRSTWLWPPCQCEGAQRDRAQQEIQRQQIAEQQKISEYEQHLQRAGLTGLLRQCTFDEYHDRTDWPGRSEE